MTYNLKIFTTEIFLFDVYGLLAENLNPLSAERKFAERNLQDMIYMLWEECVSASFYKFVCCSENFIYLNGTNVLYLKTMKMILKHVTENQENYCQMHDYFEKH